MKNDFVILVLALIVLVAAGAAEELSPKWFGVGFPWLLTVTLAFGARRTALAGSVFAVAAGAMEDALSALPPLVSVGFFLAAAAVMRLKTLPRLTAFGAYPVYWLWLAVWVHGAGGGLFGRVLMALPVGAVTFVAAELGLGWLERRAAVDAA